MPPNRTNVVSMYNHRPPGIIGTKVLKNWAYTCGEGRPHNWNSVDVPRVVPRVPRVTILGVFKVGSIFVALLKVDQTDDSPDGLFEVGRT